MELTREKIDELFEKAQDETDALIALYEAVLPVKWNDLIKIKGWPSVGRKAGEYIIQKFVDRFLLNSNCSITTSLWFNRGFSTLQEGLKDWEVDISTCQFEIREGENG